MKLYSKINVVHVTQYLEIGGLETFILEFCRQIDKNAFNVSVLCLNGYDINYKNYLEQYGIPVKLITKKFKYDIGYFIKAANILKEDMVDIVHSHGGCLFYSCIIGRLAGAKQIIYTAHGMPIMTGIKSKIEEIISGAMVDKIVAVSNQIAEYYKSIKVFNINKVEIILNGIDCSRYIPCTDLIMNNERKALYGLPRHGKIIGSVGRLEKVKDYPVLLKAFAELLRHFPNNYNLLLVIVGSGGEETALKMLAKELSIADRVRFLGMQYDLPNIYPLFDLFALSSITEGTSISLLEAQSCGIPAVVTDVGGNSNIIQHGKNGLLCRPGDYVDMAAKLYRLLNNDAERSSMKISAREVISTKFAMSSMLEKYQQIYCGGAVRCYQSH